MNNQSDWEVQVIVYSQEYEEIDRIKTCPGLRMRKWLTDVLPLDVPTGPYRPLILLTATYLPLGYSDKVLVRRDGKHFRANYKGDLITLEAAVKLMKEEMTEWLKAREEEGLRSPGKV